eukprot:g75826.t1
MRWVMSGDFGKEYKMINEYGSIPVAQTAHVCSPVAGQEQARFTLPARLSGLSGQACHAKPANFPASGRKTRRPGCCALPAAATTA